MTNQPGKKSTNSVSALDSALKLLLDLWKRFKHNAGLLVIDNLMRKTVIWYDKNHPNPTPDRENAENAVINELRAQIKAKEEEYNEQQAALDGQIRENSSLKQRITRMNEVIEKDKVTIGSLQQSATEFEARITELKEETDYLRKRCMPESDIPSMVYYAQADATGLCMRKTSTRQSSDHLYKLITKPGDTSECRFSPIIAENMSDIIANRSLTLLVCDIVSIAPASTSIELVEEGEAVLENNRWKVTSKAKIKLI